MGFATLDIPTRVIFIVIMLIIIAIMLFNAWNRSELKDWSSWFFPGLLLVIVVPLALMEARWQTYENFGSVIVKEVSGKETGYLHCQRLTEAFLDGRMTAGEVWSNAPDRAIMKFSECQTYMGLKDRLFFGAAEPTLQEVTAVAIIIHEAVHVSGNFNEAETECEAKQKLAGVLNKYFKMSKQQANLSSLTYAEQVSSRLPAKYQMDECEIVELS